MNLYAKYLKNKVRVTFNVGPNAQPIEVKEYEPGSQLGTIPVTANKGYEFKGWYTTQTFDEGTLVNETYQIDNNVTLYAKIEVKKLIEGNIQFGSYGDGKLYSNGKRDASQTGTITPEHGTRVLKYGSKKPLNFYISNFLIYPEELIVEIRGLQLESFSLTLDKFNIDFKRIDLNAKLHDFDMIYTYEIIDKSLISEIYNYIQANASYKYNIYNDKDLIFDETDLYFITTDFVLDNDGMPRSNYGLLDKEDYPDSNSSIYPETLADTNASFKYLYTYYTSDTTGYDNYFNIGVNKNNKLKEGLLKIDLGYDINYFENPIVLDFEKSSYNENVFSSSIGVYKEYRSPDGSSWHMVFSQFVEGDFIPLRIKFMEKGKVTVTFNAGVNASLIETSKEYDVCSYLGNINITVNEGYEFKGWYTTPTFDESSLVNSETLVETNMNLYAYVTNEKINNPKSPQECDHFFSNMKDFENRINQICAQHNNDLSEVTLGFADCITGLDNSERVFPRSLIKAPKMIFGRNITMLRRCFYNCIWLRTIPSTIFDKCTHVINFERCFCNCSLVTSDIPDAWNKKKFPNATMYWLYASSCEKASNYADIPDAWK